MKLAIIGSGNIGKSIGSWAAEVGYEVIFSARNIDHAKAAAEAAGHGASAAEVGESLKTADMVLLAVPYFAVHELIADIRPLLKDKILIDVTNALNADYSGLVCGFSTSGAETIAALAPEAKVIKAFNTVFAPIFAARNPNIGNHVISVVYAGDDAEAKGSVRELITKLGFDAVDAGGLVSAREIEPLGMLNIKLGYQQGLGTGISFSLLRQR
jgi:8-hydroxy-5-deazaflavin:NADPH oxidoreductase